MRCASRSPQDLSVEVCRTPWSDFNFNCLPLRQTNQLSPTSSTVNSPAGLAQPRVESQLTSFSKSPNSQPIASGHDGIHTPVLFPIWGFYYDISDCHILCARGVNCSQCVCTCTKSRKVQSPTKPNDKI